MFFVRKKFLNKQNSFKYFKIFIIILCFCCFFSFVTRADNANTEYSNITLPQKIEGIEKIEYLIDGESKGSTDGKITPITVKNGSKINFFITFNNSCTNLNLSKVKIVSNNGSELPLELYVYEYDSAGNIITRKVTNNEIANPNQTYVTSTKTIKRDETFSISGVEQNKFSFNLVIDENAFDTNKKISDIFDVFYRTNRETSYTKVENDLIEGIDKNDNLDIQYKLKSGISGYDNAYYTAYAAELPLYGNQNNYFLYSGADNSFSMYLPFSNYEGSTASHDIKLNINNGEPKDTIFNIVLKENGQVVTDGVKLKDLFKSFNIRVSGNTYTSIFNDQNNTAQIIIPESSSTSFVFTSIGKFNSYLRNINRVDYYLNDEVTRRQYCTAPGEDHSEKFDFSKSDLNIEINTVYIDLAKNYGSYSYDLFFELSNNSKPSDKKEIKDIFNIKVNDTGTTWDNLNNVLKTSLEKDESNKIDVSLIYKLNKLTSTSSGYELGRIKIIKYRINEGTWTKAGNFDGNNGEILKFSINKDLLNTSSPNKISFKFSSENNSAGDENDESCNEHNLVYKAIVNKKSEITSPKINFFTNASSTWLRLFFNDTAILKSEDNKLNTEYYSDLVYKIKTYNDEYESSNKNYMYVTLASGNYNKNGGSNVDDTTRFPVSCAIKKKDNFCNLRIEGETGSKFKLKFDSISSIKNFPLRFDKSFADNVDVYVDDIKKDYENLFNGEMAISIPYSNNSGGIAKIELKPKNGYVIKKSTLEKFEYNFSNSSNLVKFSGSTSISTYRGIQSEDDENTKNPLMGYKISGILERGEYYTVTADNITEGAEVSFTSESIAQGKNFQFYVNSKENYNVPLLTTDGEKQFNVYVTDESGNELKNKLDCQITTYGKVVYTISNIDQNIEVQVREAIKDRLIKHVKIESEAFNVVDEEGNIVGLDIYLNEDEILKIKVYEKENYEKEETIDFSINNISKQNSNSNEFEIQSNDLSEGTNTLKIKGAEKYVNDNIKIKVFSSEYIESFTDASGENLNFGQEISIGNTDNFEFKISMKNIENIEAETSNNAKITVNTLNSNSKIFNVTNISEDTSIFLYDKNLSRKNKYCIAKEFECKLNDEITIGDQIITSENIVFATESQDLGENYKVEFNNEGENVALRDKKIYLKNKSLDIQNIKFDYKFYTDEDCTEEVKDEHLEMLKKIIFRNNNDKLLNINLADEENVPRDINMFSENIGGYRIYYKYEKIYIKLSFGIKKQYNVHFLDQNKNFIKNDDPRIEIYKTQFVSQSEPLIAIKSDEAISEMATCEQTATEKNNSFLFSIKNGYEYTLDGIKVYYNKGCTEQYEKNCFKNQGTIMPGEYVSTLKDIYTDDVYVQFSDLKPVKLTVDFTNCRTSDITVYNGLEKEENIYNVDYNDEINFKISNDIAYKSEIYSFEIFCENNLKTYIVNKQDWSIKEKDTESQDDIPFSFTKNDDKFKISDLKSSLKINILRETISKSLTFENIDSNLIVSELDGQVLNDIEVYNGNNLEFQVVPAEGYEFKVPNSIDNIGQDDYLNIVLKKKDNDEIIYLNEENFSVANGIYAIKNVTEDMTIQVYGAKKIHYNVIFTPYDNLSYLDVKKNGDDITIIDNNVEIEYKDSIIFSFKLAEMVAKSDIKVYFNEKEQTSINEKINDDGTKTYTFEMKEIKEKMRISIEGIEKSLYNIKLQKISGLKYYNQYGTEELISDSSKSEDSEYIVKKVAYGEDLNFKIVAEQGVDITNLKVFDKKAKDDKTAESDIFPSLLGKKSSEYFYTISNVKEEHIVYIEGQELVEYTVEIRKTEGVICTDTYGKALGTSEKVKHGENFSFKLSVDPIYSQSSPTVEIKGTKNILKPDSSGIYTLENITENKILDIIGIKKNTYKVKFKKAEGVIYKTVKNKVFSDYLDVEYGSSLNFQISLMDAYDSSTPYVLLNGRETVSGSGGIYTVESINSDVEITVENVVKNAEENAMETITTVPENVSSQTDVDKIAEATNAYNSLSEEEKSLVTNLSALNQAQKNAAVYNHTDNDVTVTGIDWNIKLVVDFLNDNQELIDKLNQEIDRKEIISLYDIKLLDILTNETYHVPYGQEVTVTVPCPNVKGYENIVVVHETSAGGIEYLNVDISNSTAQFKTSSFSKFAIAGKKIPNYLNDVSDIKISVADLVEDEEELKSLLGEGLTSQIGELINTDDTFLSSNDSKQNDYLVKDENEDPKTFKNIIYKWAIEHELLSVIIVIFLGILIITIIFLLTFKKGKSE